MDHECDRQTKPPLAIAHSTIVRRILKISKFVNYIT